MAWFFVLPCETIRLLRNVTGKDAAGEQKVERLVAASEAAGRKVVRVVVEGNKIELVYDKAVTHCKACCHATATPSIGGLSGKAGWARSPKLVSLGRNFPAFREICREIA